MNLTATAQTKIDEAQQDARRRLAQSLALHGAAADKVAADPSLLTRVLANLDRFEVLGTMHPYCAEGWRARLHGPLHELLAFLRDPSQLAQDFRSASPFVGILTADERAQLLSHLRDVQQPVKRGK